MRKLIWIAIFVLTFSLGLAGCATRTNEEGKTGSTAKMTDSELKDKIKAKFDADPQLRAADLSISADADTNTATLSGTVPSEELRTRAVRLAESAHPGLRVTSDKIDVKRREVSRAEYNEEMAKEERAKAKG